MSIEEMEKTYNAMKSSLADLRHKAEVLAHKVMISDQQMKDSIWRGRY
jgi:hypothetical protein